MEDELINIDSPVNMDEVLNWTARMSVNEEGISERIGIVKSILYQMTSNELKKITSIISHARARMNKLESKWKRGMVAPSKEEDAIALPNVPPEQPIFPYPTPQEFELMPKHRLWWTKFKKSDFIAFDVEFVEVIKNASIDKHKGGIVAVWQNESNYLHQQVQWDPKDVKITNYTIKLNGITYKSLAQGLKFSSMKSQIENIFKNKIIITVGGNKDFRSLDLDEKNFMTFDLQSFYNRTDPNNQPNEQGMSLRDINFYHFKSDCQRGEHSALNDAKNTYKCFFEGYVKPNNYFWNEDGTKKINFNEEVNLNSKQKHQNLLYCPTMKMFAKNCGCISCKIKHVHQDCKNINLF